MGHRGDFPGKVTTCVLSFCLEEHSSTQESTKGSAGQSRDRGEDDIDF